MYVYLAYVLEENKDIFAGMFDSPDAARAGAEKIANDRGLIVGETCGICVQEHYIK